MILRIAAVGLLAITSVGTRAQTPAPFSADIQSVWVEAKPMATRVVIFGQSVPDGFVPTRPYPRGRRLEALDLHVWVLRKDGTALRSTGQPQLGGTGNGGWRTESMTFQFGGAKISELVGAVVSVDGKLLVHQIVDGGFR